LASTTAVLELVKLVTGKGVTYKFPQYFTMDLLTGEGWSVQEVGMKSISTYKQRGFKKMKLAVCKKGGPYDNYS